jgi:arylsulfatase A-like enzyme
VPLILWRPGAVPAGKRVDAPVSLTALPVTLLEETGEQVHPKFPQTSLLNLATGAAAQTSGVISEVAQLSWNPRFPDYDGAMESITTENWHYIQGGKFHDELFACCSDRLEQPNLADTAIGRSVMWKLRQEMAQALGK